MKKQRLWLLLLFLLAALPVLAQDDTTPPVVIELERRGIMPEGIEYSSASDQFLVSSLTQGTIFGFGLDGELQPFIEDGDIPSSVGIEVDEANNRLLVAVSQFTAAFGGLGGDVTAALAAYDLGSGERLFFTDLGDLNQQSAPFINDVTVDDQGNAYVTDSSSDALYVVSPEGEASVFVRDERLTSEEFGMNGIVYHPDGYLLVAVDGLIKIPLDAPGDLSRVEAETALRIDGMIFTPDHDLVAVASVGDSQGRSIVAVRSEDDWATASIIGTVITDGNATTVAQRGEDFYYTKAYFTNPFRGVYDIVRVSGSALFGDEE